MHTDETASSPKGNYFHRYLNFAIFFLENYKGEVPFHLYLKKYFALHKKHGSKDRKQISSLCYNFFRLGFGVSSTITITEKLLLATFLLESKPSELLQYFKPDWNEKVQLELQSKLEVVKTVFSLEKIFPYFDDISKQINFEDFCFTFLIQPKLFIRIRPGKERSVFQKLENANISFEKISQNCLGFSNTTKITEVLKTDKEAVIQDYNSQKTLNLFTSHIPNPTSNISIWDCCAASGGKSILVHDLLKNIELTVSDTRKSILENLRFRFAKAGIKKYNSFVADLSVSKPIKQIEEKFDLIIADVPCSGSGTWARTPEQLLYFTKSEILKYAELQQKIVLNAVRYLKAGGYFLYITCSVFKKENEENVNFIQQNLNLQLIKSEYLNGYEMQADTLFTALFKNRSKAIL